MINYTLPIEYDNSLSYYEQLCKLNKIIIDIQNSLNGDISGLVNSFLKDNFDKLVVGAIYDSSTETLTIGGKYSNGFIR